VSLHLHKDFIPDCWRTKLFCEYCSEYFPLKFLGDHDRCAGENQRFPTYCTIQVCELFTQEEIFARFEAAPQDVGGLVPLLVHGKVGYFYGRGRFAWTNPVIWAPRWVVAIDEAEVTKEDKNVVIPLAAQDREIRGALESLLWMTEAAHRAAMVKRFIADLAADNEVAQIVPHKTVG